MNEDSTLLAVRDLRTHFTTHEGLVKAVDGVSFDVNRGRTFALVGESGCGKSVTALSILGLLQQPPARIASGEILFEGTDLLGLGRRQMREIRGGKISMVFQEPMTSLNPVYTCGSQIVEAVRLHSRMSAREARLLTADMLTKVGIADPGRRMKDYPHELSGGMRQRVMIAMALACQPGLLIADEPTTALDVTIQAQILDLLKELQSETSLSMMLITHDLAVVAETAHSVAVMYASKLAEMADASEVFSQPEHPYTRGLLNSLPKLGQREARLAAIAGNVPDPMNFPIGCKFHTRCPFTRELAKQAGDGQTTEVICQGYRERVLRQCATEEPTLRQIRPNHWCACWLANGYKDAPQSEFEGIKDT